MDPEPLSYRYDVFISYSHDDASWVWDSLLPTLTAAGLRVCIDENDFEVGRPVMVNIERAVADSRHTLVVLTPAWLASTWGDFEALLAGTADPNGAQRRVWPLRLKRVKLSEQPARLRALTQLDLSRPGDRERKLKMLVKQLHGSVRPVASPATELSPFIVGPPITHPLHFFGRNRELGRLFGLWRRLPLQNAAVIGPPRSGKTSLLKYLLAITSPMAGHLRAGQRSDWLAQPERYRWVYVDFQDPRLGQREGLLRHLLQAMELSEPDPCNLDRFMEVVSNGLNSPVVVLLDEIGVALERYAELDDTFWEGLRSLASHQTDGNLGFVLAAHQPPSVLARQTNRSSPFFNLFGYTTTLGPFAEDEALELIRSSPVPVPDDDAAWMLAESGRWPILLQILCREWLAAADAAGASDEDWRAEAASQSEPFRRLLMPR